MQRMSRHIYDVCQMLKSPVAERAITDRQLYHQVVEHRRAFIGLRGFDYDTLYPATLDIVPPPSVMSEWKADYENMRMYMIYGRSAPFEELVEMLRDLNREIKDRLI